MHRHKQAMLGRWPSFQKEANKSINNLDRNYSNTDLLCVPGADTDSSAETTTMPCLHSQALSCPGQQRNSQPQSDADWAACLAVPPPQPFSPSSAPGLASGENSNLGDLAISAIVGSGQRGLSGSSGQAAALDHLAGVVDDSCVERSMLGSGGNYPAFFNRDTSLAPDNVTPSEGTPWSPSGTALSVHQQGLLSVTSSWHTLG